MPDTVPRPDVPTILLALAVTGLGAGLAAWALGRPHLAGAIWVAGTAQRVAA